MKQATTLRGILSPAQSIPVPLQIQGFKPSASALTRLIYGQV